MMTETKIAPRKKAILVCIPLLLAIFYSVFVFQDYLNPTSPLTLRPLNVTRLDYQLVDKITGHAYPQGNVTIYINGDATRNMSLSEIKWGSKVAIFLEIENCYPVSLLVDANSLSLTCKYAYFVSAGKTIYEASELSQLNTQASFDGSTLNLGAIPTYAIAQVSEELK